MLSPLSPSLHLADTNNLKDGFYQLIMDILPGIKHEMIYVSHGVLVYMHPDTTHGNNVNKTLNYNICIYKNPPTEFLSKIFKQKQTEINRLRKCMQILMYTIVYIWHYDKTGREHKRYRHL